MVIDQTYCLLERNYHTDFENLTVSDVRIGLYLTAVRLSDNSYGIASTLTDEHPFCTKENRDYGEFSPSKIIGHKVKDLLETTKESGIILTLKIASLNAISSGILSSGRYPVIENCDPIDLIDLQVPKTITMVGAFHSYIRKIAPTNNRLFVLELDEKAFSPDQMHYYVPAEDYPKVLPESDIIIITGLTLVNNTIDGLLSAIPPHAEVIVTGPSSSIIPDVLFANKVNIIGATRLIRTDAVFDLVSQAAAGYHLFKYCAQKICILNQRERPAV